VPKLSVIITACLHGVSCTVPFFCFQRTELKSDRKLICTRGRLLICTSPYAEINNFYPEKINYEVAVNLRSTNFKSEYLPR
jgi:hypothetical protein